MLWALRAFKTSPSFRGECGKHSALEAASARELWSGRPRLGVLPGPSKQITYIYILGLAKATSFNVFLRAVVYRIFKGGDKCDINNYRPDYRRLILEQI